MFQLLFVIFGVTFPVPSWEIAVVMLARGGKKRQVTQARRRGKGCRTLTDCTKESQVLINQR